MNIASIRSILSIVSVSASLAVMPVAGFAKPLTITNGTKRPVIVFVNHENAREFGVLRVMSSSTVDENALARLCGGNASRCLGEIHKQSNPSDNPIANFIFNTKTGLTGEGAVAKPFTLVIHNTEVVVGEP